MPPTVKISKKERNIKSAQKGLQSIADKLKTFLKVYEVQCNLIDSAHDLNLKAVVKKYKDESKLLVRFTLQTAAEKQSLPIKLRPLIKALRTTWYKAVTDLYFWDLDLPYEEIYALVAFLEQPSYCVEYLELLDCNIDVYSIERFSSCFAINSTLKTIVLDYTLLNDDGVIKLCDGLMETKNVTKLSLRYCNITVKCGSKLGQLVANTAISELYVDGNHLECDGLVELIRLIVDRAEIDSFERKQQKETDMVIQTAVNGPPSHNQPSTTVKETKTKKGKKKKKSAKKTEPPKIGPWLNVLHIANNGIDNFNNNFTKNVPFEVTRLLRSWIVNSMNVKEIDLDDNLIGDLAARELLLALQERKEAGLKAIYMKVTHRIDSEILKKIFSLASPSTKRGKKGKKKKKGNNGKRRI